MRQNKCICCLKAINWSNCKILSRFCKAKSHCCHNPASLQVGCNEKCFGLSSPSPPLLCTPQHLPPDPNVSISTSCKSKPIRDIGHMQPLQLQYPQQLWPKASGTNLQSRRFQTLHWSGLAWCQNYSDQSLQEVLENEALWLLQSKRWWWRKSLLPSSLLCTIKYFSNPQWSCLTLRDGTQTNPGCVVVTWL